MVVFFNVAYIYRNFALCMNLDNFFIYFYHAEVLMKWLCVGIIITYGNNSQSFLLKFYYFICLKTLSHDAIINVRYN